MSQPTSDRFKAFPIIGGICVLLLLLLGAYIIRSRTPRIQSDPPSRPTTSAAAPSKTRAPLPALPPTNSPVSLEKSTNTRLTLRGTIRSAKDRTPIHGATIRLTPSGATTANLPTAFQATTDHEGAYQLNYTEEFVYVNVSGQAVTVVAEGFAGRIVSFRSGGDEKRDLPPVLDFLLFEGGSIDGTVSDAHGAGIEGAILSVNSLDQGTQNAPFATTTSGSGGAFHLSGVETGVPVFVSAVAEGWRPACSSIVRAGATDVKIILDDPSLSLTGTVVDSTGDPVQGAMVTAAELSLQSDTTAIRISSQVATTDRNGRFALPNLWPGDWYVSVRSSRGSASVHAPLTESTDLKITLGKETIIAGRFIEKETGKGVAGIRVRPSIGSVPPWSPVTSAGDGTFEVSYYPPVTADSLAGFRALVELPEPWRGADVANPFAAPSAVWGTSLFARDFVPGGRNSYEFSLTRGIMMRGTVVEHDGVSPVSGGSFTWSRMGSSFHSDISADGRFNVSVEPGKDFKLSARCAKGIGELLVTAAEITAGKEFKVVLEGLGAISGTITNNEAHPVSGILVYAVASKYERSRNTAVTDEKGYYFLEGVESGPRLVWLEIPSPSTFALPEPARLDVKAGGIVEHVDFQLAEGDELHGIVIDEESNLPIEGATAKGRRKAGGWATSQPTASDGRFVITGLDAKEPTSQVVAEHPDYDTAAIENVSAYSGEVELKLLRFKTMHVVAKHGDTKAPVTRCSLAIISGGSPVFGLPEGFSGIRYSPEGKYDLRVPPFQSPAVEVSEVGESGMPTGRRGRTAFDLKDGLSVEVILESGTISGTVVSDVSGEAIPGAKVSLNPFTMGSAALPPPPPSQETNSRGAFSFTGLADGTYEISAAGLGFVACEPEKVVLQDRKTNPRDLKLQLRLTSGFAVQGHIRGADGNVIEDVTVSLQPYTVGNTPLVRMSGTSDVNGEYRIPGVPSGSYNVRIILNGSVNKIDDVEVKDADVLHDIDLATFVDLSGNFSANGVPASGRDQPALDGTGGLRYLRVGADGKYRVLLPVGSYVLRSAERACRKSISSTRQARPARTLK